MVGWNQKSAVGNFVLAYDEALIQEQEALGKGAGGRPRTGAGGYLKGSANKWRL
jgi:hypothetical protein